ncbi:hypothetical protein GCM10010211_66340 [Streptomyces albospinus]|uniref:Uncharacterized protein n=1 Tax=Streptomyces albospinus TaxID=285515 RepID=A0ABQ2VJP3_9ACTN|nr:hypothetical protein GCM10010211_66340 [Streptomyces albospinus]
MRDAGDVYELTVPGATQQRTGGNSGLVIGHGGIVTPGGAGRTGEPPRVTNGILRPSADRHPAGEACPRGGSGRGPPVPLTRRTAPGT